MDKQLKLNDGRILKLREMQDDDLERSFAFFQALPPEDRNYLRVDVTQREAVKQRIADIQAGIVKRIIALDDDHIVADGSLFLETSGWKRHIAEIRLIIARDYQRIGLGMQLAGELHLLAVQEGVEEIIVNFMKPQEGAMKIFTKLGFHQQCQLPSYVKDIHGQKHDLIVMRCDLKVMWDRLEDELDDFSWQRMQST